jgi:hypothetical protein
LRLGYHSLFLIANEVDATFGEVNIRMSALQHYTDLGFEFVLATRKLNELEFKE